MVWYCTQKLAVRWGNCFSSAFNVTNGVRQGGILSPLLFNLYVDELSSILNNTRVGCLINNVTYNHLIYADDTVLIAPSARALQLLLAHCDSYASNCDILFNKKKTVCMLVKPKCLKSTIAPPMLLSNNVLKYVSSQKYLGVTISNDSKDDCEIAKQCRNLYARGNTVISNFRNCSDDVKFQLLRLFARPIFVPCYGQTTPKK